ncbi:DUF6480 family protein [Cellulomonas aerilata]|uniref:Uncharacterized protein n=1 Tax=Cellulomonas aerilata TaxID=515326 RepID=A0A512D7Q1_9CELL|nr:DUF6480 family protein [Cellulomonas aerilata]GEO32504.1 hypothetical protein CAE01nite_02290 [Cellulomonas aerilata]
MTSQPSDKPGNLPTDPDPENTPGLEPGNGVNPGDTPPGEASTSGNTFREPKLPSSGANKAVYVGIFAVVALVIVMLVGYGLGIG